MILIGQFDSPFVRRVGIALVTLELDFEHRPWSTFADADRIRAFSPTVRVPVLVSGPEDHPDEVLIDTFAILGHLNALVPEHRRLTPPADPARRRALKISALAAQVSETAVSLFYERVLHAAPSAMFVERRTRQLLDGIAALERERAARPTPFWFGERLLNADIAVAAMLRHAAESLPDIVAPAAFPALAAFLRGAGGDAGLRPDLAAVHPARLMPGDRRPRDIETRPFGHMDWYVQH